MRLLVLLLSASAFAAGPENVGEFSGLLFTGPSASQTMRLDGGALTNCALDAGHVSDIYKCELKGALLTVGSSGVLKDDYLFQKATVLLPRSGTRRHYYYRGLREIEIAGRKVSQPVELTINVDTEKPERITGFLDLSEASAQVRSWFEAYR